MRVMRSANAICKCLNIYRRYTKRSDVFALQSPFMERWKISPHPLRLVIAIAKISSETAKFILPMLYVIQRTPEIPNNKEIRESRQYIVTRNPTMKSNQLWHITS